MLNYQDQTGFLWGFDENGLLSRFDGYDFREIIGQSDHSQRNCFQPLYDQDIEASATILEDNDQKVWMISGPCSIVQYDPKENTIKDYQDILADISGLQNPILYTSYKDEEGGLWWGSQAGIFHFSSLTQTFEFFKVDSVSQVKVMSIFEDQKGYLWCRHEEGFSKFDRKKKQFLEHITLSERESDDLVFRPSDVWAFISTFKLGEQDRFLFLGLKKSLYFDVAQKKLVELPTPLAPGEVFTAGFRIGKECILGTSRGNLWKMREDGVFAQLLVPGLEKITNSIFSLFEDREGVVWMGVIINSMNNFETYKIIPGPEIEFFPGKTEVNLFIFNGIAVGLSEYGLEGIKEGHDLASKFNLGYTAPSSWASFHQPVVDVEGDIWVGTAKNSVGVNNFLYEFGPDGSLKSSYSGFGTDSLAFFSEPLSDLKLDPEGILWISCNGKGLISLDLDTRTFEYYPETQKGQFFLLFCDTKGTVWMKYQGDGLSRFFPASGTFTHYQPSPDDSCSISDGSFGKIFEDSQGTIWVGSFNGLNRWDSLNDCFHRYYQKDGLSGGAVHSIFEDQNGDVWVTSPVGVSK